MHISSRVYDNPSPVFALIQQRIEQILADGPVATTTLLQQLKDIHKDKVWQVIEFLQAEKKIAVNEDGLIRKN